MRIPIREQLALLILLASLISLAVVAIATWISNHHFVLSIRASRLALIASLKASQLTSNLNVMQTSVGLVSTRIVVQNALMLYNTDGNNTAELWLAPHFDMESALRGTGLSGGELLLQTMIFPKNASGPAGYTGLLNTTSSTLSGQIKLPYRCPDGSQAFLGSPDCAGLGYPPSLYPNLTYLSTPYNSTFDTQQIKYNGVVVGPQAQSGLLLGPWQINSTFSLVSLTVPVINNTSAVEVLGWLTAVMDARLIQEVLTTAQGLGKTGETLLVGPVNSTNLFSNGITYNTNHGDPPADFQVRYVTNLNTADASRHPGRIFGTANLPFNASQYPAVVDAITENAGDQNNAGSLICGHNEAGKRVSAGYAMPSSDLIDWVVMVEQTMGEVWEPISHLRDILLACVFATAGLMAIVAFPLAHFASLPIRRLREATAKSVEPPGNSTSRSSLGSFDSVGEVLRDGPGDVEAAEGVSLARKEGFQNPLSKVWQKRQKDRELRREQRRRRAFRIPGKVEERKHIVKDELSDLTTTFNEMSDELMMQYEKLEERVQQRTAELELSRKAAEAANESKTLFIANISHELKTPLNGIMGMCAVCMQEDDPIRLKRSLGIIYKSGDLLLNLLTDLLTFSKNQVGQHLALDEKEFRLRDISSQTLAIFEKQANEGKVGLKVEWEGIQNLPSDDHASPERSELGPQGTGRMKDMILWGDMQRILQVVINLVSNALKFTSPGGSVVLTIRCLPELPELGSRKTSRASRQSRQLSSRHKGSDVTLSGGKMDTANAINVKDKPNAHVYTHDRSESPPPGKYLYYEFEVVDTGPGISENLQQKIFEPFVQGDLALSKKFAGTGLGLSICSQLASLMRGTVGVRSTLGVGSTFTMKIPLRYLKTRADSSASSRVDVSHSHEMSGSSSFNNTDDERTPARHSRHLADESNDKMVSASTPQSTPPTMAVDSQPRLVGLSHPFFASNTPMESPGSQPAAMEQMAAEATRTGTKIRVLVAEDNKVNQEVVLRMLKLEDIYDVTVAKDGQEALDMVKESMTPENPNGFNLIFMDVQMPNMDGLQSTRLIREIGYQMPIVALTAFAEESNITSCLDSGMNYFLSKPIRRPQLKKVLKEYCAPIPEENEEPSPPEPAPTSSGQTTVVLVNAPGSEVQPERPQSSGTVGRQRPSLERNGINGDLRRPESPVSPLTSV